MLLFKPVGSSQLALQRLAIRIERPLPCHFVVNHREVVQSLISAGSGQFAKQTWPKASVGY
jgi:hypothetical protein